MDMEFVDDDHRGVEPLLGTCVSGEHPEGAVVAVAANFVSVHLTDSGKLWRLRNHPAYLIEDKASLLPVTRSADHDGREVSIISDEVKHPKSCGKLGLSILSRQAEQIRSVLSATVVVEKVDVSNHFALEVEHLKWLTEK